MKKLDFDTGSRVANTIDKRIITVVNQMLKTSTLNRTVYGKITSVAESLFSVKINNITYDNVCALKNVGEIKVGDRVMCLVPNNQFNDLTIIGVVDGTLENLDDKIWEKVYPIGSIYISINNTNPSILFGGKWRLLDEGYALWTTTTANTGGETIAAGLPNITGTSLQFNTDSGWEDGMSCSGAFFQRALGTSGRTTLGSAASYPWYAFEFDASKSNTIYGSSTTVQPPAIRVFAWERIA